MRMLHVHDLFCSGSILADDVMSWHAAGWQCGRARHGLDLSVSAQIHWFSIINSCVTVLLLTGFLATILMRVLKNDFIKYTRDDEAGAP